MKRSGIPSGKAKLSLRRRNIRLFIVSLLTLVMIVLLTLWKTATDNGGQVAAEPFCIAGNLYYVGAKDITSFLLTSPEGHVLIDGGYPGTAGIIIQNISKLGFKISDVKILVNSHAHFDHAGGLAALQKATKAELWLSEADADIIDAGGASDRNMGPLNLLVYLGVVSIPRPHIDHRFKDGEKIRLGTIELTPHITAGHTPGCTSWSFHVRAGDRDLLAVSIGSLTPLPESIFKPRHSKAQQEEFKRSFDTLRALPADIFLGSHASFFNLNKKIRERKNFIDSVAPFIDHEGYLKYIDESEAMLHKELESDAF